MLNYSSKTFSTHRAWFGLEFVTSVWQSCIYWESVLTTRADTVLEVPSGIVGDSITMQWETSPGWVEVPGQAYRVGLSITYKVRDVHLFSENLHCRADWRLKDEFLKKGWAISCHDYFSSPQWDFCLCSSFFFFSSSEVLANHSLFFHEVLLSAHHGNCETTNVLTLWWEGPREENGRAILNQPFYPICISV